MRRATASCISGVVDQGPATWRRIRMATLCAYVAGFASTMGVLIAGAMALGTYPPQGINATTVIIAANVITAMLALMLAVFATIAAPSRRRVLAIASVISGAAALAVPLAAYLNGRLDHSPAVAYKGHVTRKVIVDSSQASTAPIHEYLYYEATSSPGGHHISGRLSPAGAAFKAARVGGPVDITTRAGALGIEWVQQSSP